MKPVTVGVRELKNRLSEYLRRGASGERVVVTDRGRPVAVITAPEPVAHHDPGIATLVRRGLAQWGGGNPRGPKRAVRIRGKSVASIVIEDRR